MFLPLRGLWLAVRPVARSLVATMLVGLGLGLPHARLVGQEVDLFRELTTRGLEFSSGINIPLPGPTLKPDMDAAARDAAVRSLAGKLDWDRFDRDAISAPIMIDIDAVTDAGGERLGLTVHNAFIAHAPLVQLRDTQAMQQIFGEPGTTSGDQIEVVIEQLTPSELQQLGLHSQADSSTTFAYLELPLLNKVLIAGVVRIEKRERDDAIEFFWRLDPSFNSTQKYASRWIQLERNSVGRLIRGEAFPYLGCGGFTGVYELNKPSDASSEGGATAGKLLIESRLLLREPQEWFAGSNFLRSKLPSAMQENARSFRRTLINNQHDSSDR